MNELLLEAFRHSDWATKVLIEALKRLPSEDLQRPAHGFGSLFETFSHLVRSHASYAATLGGNRPTWLAARRPAADLDELEAWAEEAAREWERLLASEIDGERLLLLDQGAYECRASVVVAQALHHAVAHREQVRGGLADIGVKVQDLQPWEYALATGRARMTKTDA